MVLNQTQNNFLRINQFNQIYQQTMATSSAANYEIMSSSNDEANATGYAFKHVADEKNPFQFTIHCSICHLIIRNYIQINCGNRHAGCRSCIEEYEKQNYR